MNYTTECIRCGKKEFSPVQMPKNYVCDGCYEKIKSEGGG